MIFLSYIIYNIMAILFQFTLFYNLIIPRKLCALIDLHQKNLNSSFFGVEIITSQNKNKLFLYEFDLSVKSI